MMCMCNLEPSHRILALNQTRIRAYKMKNYLYTAYFAKKIIQIYEVPPHISTHSPHA